MAEQKKPNGMCPYLFRYENKVSKSEKAVENNNMQDPS